jgi:hypothetical protein
MMEMETSASYQVSHGNKLVQRQQDRRVLSGVEGSRLADDGDGDISVNRIWADRTLHQHRLRGRIQTFLAIPCLRAAEGELMIGLEQTIYRY